MRRHIEIAMFASLGLAVLSGLCGCDPEVSANWQPKPFKGRSFSAKTGNSPLWVDEEKRAKDVVFTEMTIPMFAWWDRIGINALRWFNVPMDDAHRLKSDPYKVDDAFGPKVHWNPLRERFARFVQQHPDRPFFLQIRDAGWPWFYREKYNPDCADFAKFVADHPNFGGFVTLNEFDASFTNVGPDYGGTNPVIRAQVEKLFPQPEKGPGRMRSKLKWADTIFRYQREIHGGIDDFSCLFSVDPKWAFIFAEQGVKSLVCETELYVISPPWRYSMAHVRGASRQFDIPWFYYTANLIAGYSRDGKKISGEWWTRSKEEPDRDPKYGAARSMVRRNNFYGYMCGAAGLELEVNDKVMFTTNAAGQAIGTAYAHDFDEMFRLHKSGFDRGATWTPLAVLTSREEPFQRGGYSVGCKDRVSQNAFFWTLVPTASENVMHYCDRTKGEQGCLWNSEFGEICDVLCPDLRQGSDAFLKVLRDYPAAVLVGWFPKDRLHTDALVRYVQEGGRLYVTKEQVAAGYVPATIEGKGRLVVTEDPVPKTIDKATCDPYSGLMQKIGSGKLTFPVYRDLLREVQRDFMPVTVEGDIQWGVNRTKCGWLVWLMNNKGVTKFQGEDEIDDPAATAHVKITDKATGKTIEVDVPAGGYTWREI